MADIIDKRRSTECLKAASGEKPKKVLVWPILQRCFKEFKAKFNDGMRYKKKTYHSQIFWALPKLWRVVEDLSLSIQALEFILAQEIECKRNMGLSDGRVQLFALASRPHKRHIPPLMALDLLAGRRCFGLLSCTFRRREIWEL